MKRKIKTINNQSTIGALVDTEVPGAHKFYIMYFEINPEKFNYLIKQHGFFSYKESNSNGETKKVIIQVLNDSITVVNPIELFPILKKSLDEGNTLEGLAKIKRSLIKDKAEWIDHFAKILPQFYESIINKTNE